jgi:hypothetical protein
MRILAPTIERRSHHAAMRMPRLARTVALAVILGIGIVNLYWAITQWTLSDAAAYWNAAIRLREGGELYPALSDVDASEVYRYAPWFAWLAVPFTYLPIQVAGALWSLVLLAASAWALVPLLQIRAWLLVAFFAPILIGISAVGNVQALMVAALLWGVERRSGPLWIALAASLKVTPILLVAVYAGRRQFGRVAVTLALAVLLWAPVLLYDLSGYTTTAGQAAALVQWPVVYLVASGAMVVATLALAAGRFGWLTGAVANVVALPRLFVYDVSFLMLGALPVIDRDGERPL